MRTTRFSGLDWATELKNITMVGLGGIGSWTALNLSRIGHTLYMIDPDIVDETNVTGGQMYRLSDVLQYKTDAVINICKEMGAINEMYAIHEYFSEEMGISDICICGLDNMKARKVVFDTWKKHVLSKKEEERKNCILIDGRMNSENFDVFCILGYSDAQIEEYEKKWLFTDEEVGEMDCTMKQTTFMGMGISSFITASLCNWLTNRKLDIDFREVPFYQRFYAPAFNYLNESI